MNNRMIPPTRPESRLGAYLRDRRTRLDPAALGFPLQRRRTPGLRREEVAQRAHVSATWYTWLEQGRGGAPSADVLDRLARALLLTAVEREHLFFLALGRSPEVRYEADQGISPRLQRVLDAFATSPAFVKTVTWDLVAWNRAAAAVFGYDQLPPEDRNILRRIFTEPATRAAQLDWAAVARFAVAAFRADIARAGAAAKAEGLVSELVQRSPEFAAIWRENDVRAYGEGTKKLRHPQAGLLEMEYSAFAVDGRPDLSVVVYNPATPQAAAKVGALLKRRGTPRASAAAARP
jgi:transcriptional regulator with XRE-family HTH domain